MTHPQTLAETLNKNFPNKELENIAKHACCAFTLMWCLGIEPEDDMEAIYTVKRMIDNKAIKKDCTVEWGKAVRYLTGRSMREIIFQDIKVIKNIKERTPVRYDLNGKSHWVGVENGIVAFNPLKYSNCVINGRPVTARIIKLDIAE